MHSSNGISIASVKRWGKDGDSLKNVPPTSVAPPLEAERRQEQSIPPRCIGGSPDASVTSRSIPDGSPQRVDPRHAQEEAARQAALETQQRRQQLAAGLFGAVPSA